MGLLSVSKKRRLIMAKKMLDNLTLDMIQCKQDGYGCHYGAWKAMQGKKVVKRETVVPEGWLVCRRCGTPFKPKTKRKQLYCEANCQAAAQRERYKAKRAERKRAEERNTENESNT